MFEAGQRPDARLDKCITVRSIYQLVECVLSAFEYRTTHFIILRYVLGIVDPTNRIVQAFLQLLGSRCDLSQAEGLRIFTELLLLDLPHGQEFFRRLQLPSHLDGHKPGSKKNVNVPFEMEVDVDIDFEFVSFYLVSMLIGLTVVGFDVI